MTFQKTLALIASVFVVAACSKKNESPTPTIAPPVAVTQPPATPHSSVTKDTAAPSGSNAAAGATVVATAVTHGPTGKLEKLINGDRGCDITVARKIDGKISKASVAGDFELCKGGKNDATTLIGKTVRTMTQKQSVQAASCQGDPHCKDSETVDIVSTITESPAMPIEADIKQGGEYWAVYFASADSKSELLVDAVAFARVLGYETSGRDINCDVTDPAPASDQEKMIISSYFATKAEADNVAAEYAKVARKDGAKDGAPWVGKVKTMCMD